MGIAGIGASSRIGRWLLRRCLGQGEFGSTWLANDAEGRCAAVKLLAQPPGDELRALARIVHPTVVQVYGGGGDPVPHLVMEYARGLPLTARLRKRAAPETTAISLAAHLADGLAAIHHAGVVHGDIKPDNVVVESVRGPLLKIVDFGLAGQRQGGTLNYAAPEQLRGKGSEPASDVYALGMVLWEMLHGELPWANLGLSTPLMRRQKGAPEPQVGEPWLRELLRELLAPDPTHRPTAAQLADRLAQHGAQLPGPGPDLLRRRARSLWIVAPDVDQQLDGWLTDGGNLAVAGPSGSGKSHVVDHLMRELQARGRPYLRLDTGAPSWMAVETALASAALPGAADPLPEIADPGARAEQAALLLYARCPIGFHVLADDLDAAARPCQLFAEALAGRERVHVCVTAPDAPAWAEGQWDLQPLDRAGRAALVEGLLGEVGDAGPLLDRVEDVTAGLPGAVVAFLLQAVREDALVWRAQRWHLDPVRLGEIAAEGLPELRVEVDLGEAARSLGRVFAAHRAALPLETLMALTGKGEDALRVALDQLVDAGLVRIELGRASCVSQAAATALGALDDAPHRTHRLLAEHLLGAPGASAIQLGWHIALGDDRQLVAREGPAALEAACALDGAEAGQLAEAMWELAPSEELEAPRMRALVAAGRVDEAVRFGVDLMVHRTPGSRDVPVLGMLAHIYATLRKDDDEAMELLERARIALDGAPLPEELVEIKAKAHFRAGRTYEAIESARVIADRAPPDQPERLDRWLSMRVTWAQALQGAERLDDAVELLEKLPDAVGEGRSSRALYDAALGRLLWHAGRAREAGEIMARAADEERGLPAADRARMLSNAGLARYSIGDRSGALRLWEQASLLMERLGDESHLVVVRTNLCVGYREAGMWERAEVAGKWGYDKARELEMAEFEAMAAGNLGDLAMALDQLDEAEQWFTQASRVAAEHGLESEKVELARREAELAAARNDPGTEDKARKALEMAVAAGDVVEGARASSLLALAHAREGHIGDMHRCIAEAVEPLKDAGAAGELAEVRLTAGRALLIVGQLVDALQQATRALVYADEVEHTQLRKRADGLVAAIRRLQDIDVGSQRQDRLLGLAVAVARESDIDGLLEAVASATLDLLDGERAFVLIEEGGEPRVAAARVREGVEPGQPSMTVVARAMADGREVIAADVNERGDLRDARSVLAMELKSAMCVPMLDGEQRVGALYVDSRAASEEEVSHAVKMLRALGSYAAVAIHNARQLAEAAVRAEQAAEIAHDLRSPAASIQLAAMELLEDHPDGDPKRDRVLRILDGAQRVQAMAGEFLEERSRSRRVLDLSEHVERAVALLAYEAEALSVAVDLDVEPGIEVIGDHNALSRVVANLVGNAAKYSPMGDRVTVTLASDGDEACLKVRDRGPGIPAEDLPRVFERGTQADGAVEGHGLGLAIVLKLVEEHGGTVEAANHPDGGALFTVRLPLATS